MTLDERITLCRFLIKIEDREAYCASIGVRDTSKLRGKKMAKISPNGEKSGETENRNAVKTNRNL